MIQNRIFISIVSISLLWIFALAELNNLHFDPQPQFWTEACVTWGIIALSIITVYKSSKITLPFIIFPLILFAIYITLQPVIINNTIGYNGLNYIVALEMLVCVLLASSINTLIASYNRKLIFTILAYVLFIGAILQSLIGMAQYLNIARHFSFIFFYDSSHPTTNIFGHFGQRNHYAHYLSWGTFSLIYLYCNRKIPTIAFTTFMLWLCFALTLSASRSVFIYFGLASIIALVSLLSNRNDENKLFVKVILITTITLFAIQFLYPLVYKIFHHSTGFSSGLSRIENEQGTGRRTIEWQKAILTFKEFPIWGIGWGGFARQSVNLHPLFPDAALNSGLFTNCHNLILQLLSETGIVGTIILMGGLVIALIRLVYKNLTIETLTLLCLIGTTMSHSMNEYPLWYIYFLAGFITFLSFDKPILTFSNKAIKIIFSVTALVLAYLLVTNSFKFDKLVDYYDAPETKNEFNQQLTYLEYANQHDVLTQYYDSFVLDNYINVDTDYTDAYMSIESQYNYTKRFEAFHPYPDTMIKLAMLQYNLNQPQQAESTVELACNAFPVYTKSFKQTLSDSYYADLLKLVK